jgi:hypothetical protein
MAHISAVTVAGKPIFRAGPLTAWLRACEVS